MLEFKARVTYPVIVEIFNHKKFRNYRYAEDGRVWGLLGEDIILDTFECFHEPENTNQPHYDLIHRRGGLWSVRTVTPRGTDIAASRMKGTKRIFLHREHQRELKRLEGFIFIDITRYRDKGRVFVRGIPIEDILKGEQDGKLFDSVRRRMSYDSCSRIFY